MVFYFEDNSKEENLPLVQNAFLCEELVVLGYLRNILAFNWV